MDILTLTRFIIGLIITIVILVFVVIKLFIKVNPFTVSFILKTGIFAAISTILYIVPYLKFPVFFFPSFLEVHLDEIPAFIGAFAYGPFCGFLIILIKTIIKLPMTSTMCVGEFADFIYSISFIIPAAIIYKKHRNVKGAISGLFIGTIIQLFVSSFLTSFGILNFYMFVMGLSEETILNMCKAINPNVNSLGFTFLLLVALPFNAFKDGIVIVATFLLYKRMHLLFDKISIKKPGF